MIFRRVTRHMVQLELSEIFNFVDIILPNFSTNFRSWIQSKLAIQCFKPYLWHSLLMNWAILHVSKIVGDMNIVDKWSCSLSFNALVHLSHSLWISSVSACLHSLPDSIVNGLRSVGGSFSLGTTSGTWLYNYLLLETHMSIWEHVLPFVNYGLLLNLVFWYFTCLWTGSTNHTSRRYWTF